MFDVQKRRGKYNLLKDNKAVKSYSDQDTANHVAKVMSNIDYKNRKRDFMDEFENVALEHGFTLTGVALTNTPHLRLVDAEITVVEKEDGKKLLRIPILRKGVFDYKGNKLNLTDRVFDQIIENHEVGVTDYKPSLNRHHQRSVADAWFHKERGGYLQKEGDFLVAYGSPTGDDVLDLIKSGKYAYASAELSGNYRSNMISVKMEDLKYLSDKELTMFNYTEDESQVVFEKDEFKKVLDLVEQLKDAQDKIVELETPKEDATVALEIPREIQLQLDEQKKEIQRLKEAALQERVEKIILQASTPVEGKIFDAFTLSWAGSVLKGESLNEGEIKLEESTPSGVGAYLRKAVTFFLENAPRHVSTEPVTEPDKQEKLEDVSLEKGAVTDADLDALWAKYQ